jgi:hypothetical protein
MDEQEPPKKQCKGQCGQEYLATTEFWQADQKGKYGLKSQCKTCVSKRMKEYYNRPEVKESKLAYSKTYYSHPENKEKERTYRNRPEISARRRANRNKPERKTRDHAYSKEYRSRPGARERIREQTKDYRNRSEVQQQSKQYNRRPEVQKRKRDWNKSYYSRPGVQEYRRTYMRRPGVLERYRIHARNRHARNKAVLGTHSPQQIQSQLKRQRHKCYYCQKHFQKVKGQYIFHIEHTFPLSRVAGTDIPANSIDYIVLACPTCNLSKGNKFPWEWDLGGRLI